MITESFVAGAILAWQPSETFIFIWRNEQPCGFLQMSGQPAHHHKWTAQPGAPFHREANAYDAPPSPGMGTSTTFERSRTGEPLLSLLFRQSPAQTRNPIISPTDG